MPKRGRDGAAKQSKAKRQATAEAKYMAGVEKAVPIRDSALECV